MRFRSPSGQKHSQRGYMLLMLMLAVALMAIAAVAIAPTLAFEVKRDREEELIHRGVQYSRAVRRYYKKFGRYPTRIEDLENSNNLRFLRKRYKDPITGQDFKLLHYGEVQMAMGGGIMGGVAPGTPIGNGPAGTQTSQSGQFLSSGASSGQSGQFLTGGTGGGQSSQFSLSSSSNSQSGASPQTPGQGEASTDSANSSSSSDASAANSTSSNQSGPNQGANTGQPGGQTFGGGPIVGVVSASKLESIRIFNNKNHYNQWQFIYDPSTDRGGLLNTPAQPALQNAVALQPGATGATGINGATGMTGAPGGFGTQNPGAGMSPFGQQTPSPMQNQPQPPAQQPQQP